ncbi:MAG: hydrogenase maturation nickel metallochaperone HypA [Phycisphaerae bacterium]|nr:hydrogenase maturation nickel metallochaperone HypA [Phycisphaerae bacterium]
MHETVVAQNMIDAVLQEAKKHCKKPVRIKVSCGQLNALNEEVFGFAFDVVSQGTLCEGVQVEIEHKPFQAQCQDCHQTFDLDIDQPQCTACQSDSFELMPDAPLILEEIEFLEE